MILDNEYRIIDKLMLTMYIPEKRNIKVLTVVCVRKRIVRAQSCPYYFIFLMKKKISCEHRCCPMTIDEQEGVQVDSTNEDISVLGLKKFNE